MIISKLETASKVLAWIIIPAGLCLLAVMVWGLLSR